jgi:hypothetical protein
MKTFFKHFALASLLATAAATTAEAVVVRGIGLIQGGGTSNFTWTAPAAKTYKLSVYIPGNATASRAKYRIYPKGKAATSTVCSATDVQYPCFEVFVNQSLNKGKWVALKSGTTSSWAFTKTGFVSVFTNNLLKTVRLGVSGLRFAETASTKVVTTRATGFMQSKTQSTFTWQPPAAKTYNVLVYVPGTATATRVRYRVYPKGKNPTSDVCPSANVTYPCYQTFLDQSKFKNKWVQLRFGTKFSVPFTKAGVIAAWAGATTNTGMTAVYGVDFRLPLKLGQKYQGGIIFRLNATQQHGLAAAEVNQSTGMKWDDLDPFEQTNATDRAIGTGKLNTGKIVSILKTGNGKYAAKQSNDLVLNGKTDWYLPSIEELALMYKNLKQKNLGNFANSVYWSSTESAPGSAQVIDFADGNEYPYGKNTDTVYVRAVRTF